MGNIYQCKAIPFLQPFSLEKRQYHETLSKSKQSQRIRRAAIQRHSTCKGRCNFLQCQRSKFFEFRFFRDSFTEPSFVPVDRNILADRLAEIEPIARDHLKRAAKEDKDRFHGNPWDRFLGTKTSSVMNFQIIFFGCPFAFWKRT